MKDLALRGFPELAIAEGATTPVPSNSQKSVVWSTTTTSLMSWNGTTWERLYSYNDTSVELGQNASATAGYDSIAIGGSAISGNFSIAVGPGCDASAPNSTGFGRSLIIPENAVGFNRSPRSHSQVAFQSPALGSYDDINTSIFQAYLRMLPWSISTYPARLYVSNSQRLGSSHTGIHMGASDIQHYSGKLLISFNNVAGTTVLGHAVFEIVGACKMAEVSPYVTNTYTVKELESSFPGTVTVTLTTFFDSGFVGIDVDISCTLSTSSYLLDAYISLYSNSICITSTVVDASYIAAKINRDGKGTLLTASEALSAGNLVNVWNDSGTIKIRKADSNGPYAVDGYILQAIASGDKGYFYVDGINDAVSGLTLGNQFLSATAGATTTTAPTTAGNIVQSVGIALTSSSLLFQRGLPILLS